MEGRSTIIDWAEEVDRSLFIESFFKRWNFSSCACHLRYFQFLIEFLHVLILESAFRTEELPVGSFPFGDVHKKVIGGDYLGANWYKLFNLEAFN